ncbi:MAG: heparinase II/III family protein, partial [Lachnospiraceae bacterium]|nr:heparinase II/III family protein [Lachnospiraceae bacterium]
LGTMSILKSHYGDLISVIPREYYITHDHCGRWSLHINSIVWFDPKMDFNALPQDAVYYMKESEWFVKKCAAYGFAAKGGNNGEPHNHNDLGNFILCHGGRQILTDLGAGEYTRDYFGEKRYNILCNRSAGHSVPIVDGCEQCKGAEYSAKTDFDGEKLTIDITGAYPKNRVSGIVREFSFTANSVLLKDSFTFEDSCKVIERLVTQVKPEVLDGRVQLEDVRVLFDASAWEISVSEEMHANHSQGKEKVYLVDFSPKQQKSEFEAQFVIG